MTTYNPEFLKIARQFRRLSQKDLADSAGLAQGQLSKIEKGALSPRPEVCDKLATALRLPVNYFYQPDSIYGLPVSIHPMFRKRASLGQKNLDGIMAELNIRLFHIRRLLKGQSHAAACNLKEASILGRKPEEVARAVREYWRIGLGPLSNLIERVEQSGCLVVMCDFKDAQIDGVTMRLPDLPPCIFINRNIPADRLRFTLAHELGHIVLHQIPSEGMEQEANDFAAALLMPEESIRGSLVGLNLYSLAALKPVWCVSMGALLMRAKKLRTMGEQQIDYMWRQMSLAGYRTREPSELDFDRERPTALTRYLSAALTETGGLGKLSEMLCMEESELTDMYFKD